MREFLKEAQEAPKKEPKKLWVKNLRSIFTSFSTPTDLDSLPEEERPEILAREKPTGVRSTLDYEIFMNKQVTYPPEEITLKVGDSLVFKIPCTHPQSGVPATYKLDHRIYVAGKDKEGKDLMSEPIKENFEKKAKKGKPPPDGWNFYMLIALAEGSAQVLAEVSWEAEEPHLCEKLGHQEILQCDSVCQLGPFRVKIDPEEKRDKAKSENSKTLINSDLLAWNGEMWGGKPKKAKPPKMAKPK
jgi:hypothetical protein